MTALLAGAGRSDIRYPAETWPLDGFTHVHDALSVRVLVLHGDDQVVWAVVDQTSLAPAPLEAVRERLAAATGVPAAAVLVSVSHTFSAPHLADPEAVPDADAARMALAWTALLEAVDRAVASALAALAPARLRAGTGRCGVTVNRDIETSEGWGLGRNETGFTDDTLTVVRIDDLDGACRALLVGFGVQPSVLNGSDGGLGGRAVSADFVGEAMRRLERDFDGAVAFFVIGAAGDQAPALTAVRTARGASDQPAVRQDAGEGGFLLSALLGERLAEAAGTLAQTADEFAPVVSLTTGGLVATAQEQTPRERIAPTRAHVYRAAGERALPWWVLRLGQVAIAGVQPELSAITGRRIRERSPYPHTIVATLVNGGAKYLPEQDAFDRFTYEALSSYYARGSAEQLEEALAVELWRTAQKEKTS